MTRPEVWLRGPVAGIDPLLQPPVHALFQAAEDVEEALAELTTDQIWRAPGGAASVGFHVLHLIGSTDRLLTYARGETLSEAQRSRLAAERHPVHTDAASLLASLSALLDMALEQFRRTPAETLTQPRTVGRAVLPSTVIGLLFHAAEHARRHAGQAITTAKIVRALADEQRLDVG